MSYTKGPWSISRRSKSTELKDIFISAGGEYVARVVVPYTSKSIEEYEANASLIAAAPDLLEALKDSRWHIANIVGPSGGQAHERNALIKIDAAIAKATRAES